MSAGVRHGIGMAVTPAPSDRSPRLRAAIEELVDALLEDLAPPELAQPTRLRSVNQACEALGLARSTLYALMADGRLRSISVGRRRLIPEDAIAELAEHGGTSVASDRPAA
jgi:excisionase family DNA binding protein